MLTRLLAFKHPKPTRTPLSLLHAMSTTALGARTYAGAIDALNSLQSNAATINAIRASGNKQDSVQNDHSIEYLRRIGYQVRTRFDFGPRLDARTEPIRALG